MASEDFHARPFDEGTLTKLRIFELYAREWLPVFLSQERPWCREVHVFDFFAGRGTDVTGVEGSPLRMLQEIAKTRALPGWSQVKVVAHFYDAEDDHLRALKGAIEGQNLKIPDLEIEIEAIPFAKALHKNGSILHNGKAAKLLLIDQFGVDEVTAEVFRLLTDSPTCDFLFFISSSTLNRFRDHPAIKQKITRPDDHYQVHRATLEYYRSLLSDPASYHLAPFSIKKGSNIYGLIFGSRHPLGMDKFLEVAWKADAINGEADFDIHRDNIKPGQLRLDLAEFRPTKVTAFEDELESAVRQGQIRDERDVIRLCFRHGVRRKHAEAVLAKLKSEGAIRIGFRVPQIDRMTNPRPVEPIRA